MAGRNLPLAVVIATTFATWFGSETVLGAPAKFVSDGLGLRRGGARPGRRHPVRLPRRGEPQARRPVRDRPGQDAPDPALVLAAVTVLPEEKERADWLRQVPFDGSPGLVHRWIVFGGPDGVHAVAAKAISDGVDKDARATALFQALLGTIGGPAAVLIVIRPRPTAAVGAGGGVADRAPASSWPAPPRCPPGSGTCSARWCASCP